MQSNLFVRDLKLQQFRFVVLNKRRCSGSSRDLSCTAIDFI